MPRTANLELDGPVFVNYLVDDIAEPRLVGSKCVDWPEKGAQVLIRFNGVLRLIAVSRKRAKQIESSLA